MSWIEEESGVKFICWGKIKDGLTEDNTFVIKEGESVEADIVHIATNKDDDGEIESYKYRLKIPKEDKDVILWSNAAIKRQQENLVLQEGEHIQIEYVGNYKTSYGKPGRNIKIRVDRDNGKKVHNGKKKKE